jgi:hypothetical protein
MQDLTINDIIHYIEHNKQYIDQPNIIIDEEDEPDKVLTTKLQTIFGENIQRMKSLSNVSITTKNISFISSIFALMDAKYPQTDYEQIQIIEYFIKHLTKNIKSSEFNYAKYNLTLAKFSNIVKSLEMNNILCDYIATLLHINVFIIDNDITYIGETYNKYKKNIFLLKFDDNIYEPFVLIDYNSNIIKNIISNGIMYSSKISNQTKN